MVFGGQMWGFTASVFIGIHDLKEDSTRRQVFIHAHTQAGKQAYHETGAYHGSGCYKWSTCSNRTAQHDQRFLRLWRTDSPSF